ncbi:HDIG domain-containing protein [Gottschalkia purinilytica]|uniref:HDIG domain-containing protein n=1 Tax=Gottschalkia purinilytica TaxID=1503 RepID=A0A0L0WCG2_GOTPU|nr:HD domain-containing phosphohydrolase [Gottschalkia purinilytica]KNF09151.1 HDIG domain-containing protein [Gottschalkia purinilytica]
MINLSLNNLLLSLSYTLDFIEIDVIGTTSNHSKRVAYIALNIAKKLNLTSEEVFDIVSLGLLHDNGLSESNFHNKRTDTSNLNIKDLEEFKEHCIIGENNIKGYPFLTQIKDVIKYHHENYDGTGFFNIKGDNIPIMSQIISFADKIDIKFNLKEMYDENQDEIFDYLNQGRNKLFASKLVDIFYDISRKTSFKLDLQDKFINKALARHIPKFKKEMSYEEIRSITKVFSKIIDCKSKFTYRHSQGLSEKISKMADYYSKDEKEKIKLMIAADLHDLGKLAIPNYILDKSSKLSKDEFELIKKHTYYTRICLEEIDGFEDITEWASNHHEKLDGTGYPYGVIGKDLDFNSRLMACLDIYQALTEERPYRKPSFHKDCIKILYNMGKEGLIDNDIIKDIDIVFGNI